MIPRVLPDELLHGYLGRIRWVNATLNIGPILQSATDSPVKHRHRDHEIELAAHTNGLAPRELVTQHTYWTLMHARPPRPLDDQVRAALDGDRRAFPILRHTRKGAWFCTRCVDEDQAFWHLTYWRRSHQIPGAHLCLKHREPLHTVYERDAFERPPHHWLDAAESDPSNARAYGGNTIIDRYVQTYDLLADQPGYLDRVLACEALRRLGGGSSARKQRTAADVRLTSMAKAELPAEWLTSTLNIAQCDPDDQDYYCLKLSNGAKGLPLSPVGIVLASAMLHESAEAAASFLASSLIQGTYQTQEPRAIT